MTYAPGLELKWRLCDHPIRFLKPNTVLCTINYSNEAYTIGNILSNKEWIPIKLYHIYLLKIRKSW